MKRRLLPRLDVDELPRLDVDELPRFPIEALLLFLAEMTGRESRLDFNKSAFIV